MRMALLQELGQSRISLYITEEVSHLLCTFCVSMARGPCGNLALFVEGLRRRVCKKDLEAVFCTLAAEGLLVALLLVD